MTTRHTATIVCGNAGVGKSTLGTKLAREQRAVLLDIDTCTERLARLVLEGHGLDPDDRDSPDYKRLLREPVYESLFDIAVANLPHAPVVIVGPFTSERRDATWPARLRERLAAPVEIVYVRCALDERRRRIVARGNPRDAGKLANWDAYAALGEDPELPPFPHRLVDTDTARS